MKALGSGIEPCGVAGKGEGWLAEAMPSPPVKGKRLSWNSTQKRGRKKGREDLGGLESTNQSCWIWGRGQRDFPER